MSGWMAAELKFAPESGKVVVCSLIVAVHLLLSKNIIFSSDSFMCCCMRSEALHGT